MKRPALSPPLRAGWSMVPAWLMFRCWVGAGHGVYTNTQPKLPAPCDFVARARHGPPGASAHKL
jgi:hypothetical protein